MSWRKWKKKAGMWTILYMFYRTHRTGYDDIEWGGGESVLLFMTFFREWAPRYNHETVLYLVHSSHTCLSATNVLPSTLQRVVLVSFNTITYTVRSYTGLAPPFHSAVWCARSVEEHRLGREMLHQSYRKVARLGLCHLEPEWDSLSELHIKI